MPLLALKETIPANRINGFIFVIAMWLFSRLVILAVMGLIAPLIPNWVINLDPHPVSDLTPTFGWDLFARWDGGGYAEIATIGYEYDLDADKYSVAFFPLFPMVIHGLMTLGIPAKVAGTLVNNLAFLGALGVAYHWVRNCHGVSAARWTTAVLAWSPFSLFGTVIYTEGLFLLLTTAALQAFDKRQHAWAALWGAMATATRVPGAALVPAFLYVAWRERRPAIAYAAGLAASGGLLVFSVYCAVRCIGLIKA
jgi:Gpi18-like mannosyltransferase